MIDGILDSRDVAKMIGLSRQRLSQLRTSGRFPAPADILNGGAVWREKDILQWLEERPKGHVLDYVTDSKGTRWRCSCGAGTGGIRFQTAYEAEQRGKRHLQATRRLGR